MVEAQRIPTLKLGITVFGNVKYPLPVPKVRLLIVRSWKDAFEDEKLLAIKLEKPLDK